ncbi:MAG TPA: PEGA domain-containing protein [Polyangiaceae bacterium]|nr:PEGA domain-containing protein [Polyangiaceae bacterium]
MACLACVIVLGPASGRADEGDAGVTSDPGLGAARDAFVLGANLARGAQWADALAAFERSAALHPNGLTTYNVGVCERALGHYTRARDLFAAALRADGPGGSELPASVSEDARAYLGEIDAALARLAVRIDPPDARIAVDGRPLRVETGAAGRLAAIAGVREPGRGEPPPARDFDLLLDPGTHVLTLSRAGFTDILLNRTFAPGARLPLGLELDRLPATLHVAANVGPTVVTVNGADVGSTPADVSRPAGSYHVVVKKEGFVSYEAQVAVKAGEELDLRATMVEDRALTKKWWFWAGVAAVVVGGAAATYALTRPAPPPDCGNSGVCVHP